MGTLPTPYFMVEQQSNPLSDDLPMKSPESKNLRVPEQISSSTTAASVVAPPTNLYSKRANRGYNPKYEQGSFVSFSTLCGNKRKQPEMQK